VFTHSILKTQGKIKRYFRKLDRCYRFCAKYYQTCSNQWPDFL